MIDKIELYILRKVRNLLIYLWGTSCQKLGAKHRITLNLEFWEQILSSRIHDLIDFINKNKLDYNLVFLYQERDWRGNLIKVYKKEAV